MFMHATTACAARRVLSKSPEKSLVYNLKLRFIRETQAYDELQWSLGPRLAYQPFLTFKWGSHLVNFFGSGDELRDVLVPYFKAGLENNERCLWVTGKAFDAEQARSALRAAVPDLDPPERDKQIEIANGDEWYAAGEKLQPYELVKGLEQCERDALDLGYSGLRPMGTAPGYRRLNGLDFQDSETLVQKTVRGRRMICMCSYSTEQVNSGAHLEVMEHHDLAVPSARGSATRRRSECDAAGAINPDSNNRRDRIGPVSGTSATYV